MRGINEQQRERAYKNAVRQASVQNHRAERLGGGRGSFSGEAWLSLCEQHQNKCVLCGHKRPLTPDHIIPLMRGGQNTIDNIQPMCHACNIVKRGISMDYRSYAAQPAQAGLPDLTGDSSPYDDSGVEAPRPLCRAQLLYMEQGLDKQYAIGERDQVHPGPGQWSGEELIPYLVSEIKRLRHLVLANETLAHIESVAWWYRDTYPTTLENYLDMSKSAF